MSRIQRTAAPSEGGVTTAKKPLVIVGKEIEVEGTVENKIPEADLSLTNVVHLTGEETITGKKLFIVNNVGAGGAELKAEPGKASANPGGNAGQPFTIESGTGGEGTSATTAKGGIGSTITLTAGTGGIAPNAKTSSTGGTGGTFEANSGTGGGAEVGTGTNTGGEGGKSSLVAASGGPAAGVTSGQQKGGAGGVLTVASGTGGIAQFGTGVQKGGAGGALNITAGAGGEGEGAEAGTEGGTGGLVKITTGKGGNSGGTKGSGGALQVVLGTGGNSSEALSGTFSVYYLSAIAGNLRFQIGPTGLVTCKKGLTVEGATKLEGATTAAKTLKVTELTTTSGGLTVEGTLTLPSEASTLKVAAPTAVAEYTSAKEETEAKATFITLVIVVKAEAAAATVKLVNSGEEISFKWDGVALGAQRVPLTLMVKKGGKWKATLEGSAEKAEISRVTMEP